MPADCQHNVLDIATRGLHRTDGNPTRWAGYGVQVRVTCATCGAPFDFKRSFHIGDAGNGGEYLEATLVPRHPPKSAPETAPVIELDPGIPGEGTAAQPEPATEDEIEEKAIDIYAREGLPILIGDAATSWANDREGIRAYCRTKARKELGLA